MQGCIGGYAGRLGWLWSIGAQEVAGPGLIPDPEIRHYAHSDGTGEGALGRRGGVARGAGGPAAGLQRASATGRRPDEAGHEATGCHPDQEGWSAVAVDQEPN